MTKKFLVTVVAIMTMIAVLIPLNNDRASAQTPLFSDILNHWAKDSIEQAATKGYVVGYPDGTFKPNNEVTRAEFIKMIVDALAIPKESIKTGQKWFEPYTTVAISTGIHLTADFNSDWGNKLTRLEMVRIAIRGTDKTLQESREVVSNGEFLYRATTSGIVHGMTNGDLNQEGTTTRAQAVTIIERILTLNKGEILAVDHRAINYAEVEATGTNIQTMWGVPVNPLPMKVDLGSKLDISIDQLLILDMEDPNRPFKDLFPEVMMDTGEIADHHYVVALHVNIKNNNMKEHAIWSLAFKISGSANNSKFRTSYISPTQTNNTSIDVVPSFFLDKTEKVQGWYLMSIPKDNVDAGEKYKDISFWDLVHQKRVYLTPQE